MIYCSELKTDKGLQLLSTTEKLFLKWLRSQTK